MLAIDGLVVRFDGVTALDGVTLAIPAAARVGLLGPNGSGKTTLFNAISGLTALAGGTIRVDGRLTSGLPPHRIAAAGVARTFQTARLFQRLSVLDNVLPRVGAGATTSRDALDSALAALEKVGLADKSEVLAGDLDAFAQRRLEIARAMAQRPRLLLVDEPTGGLSRAEADSIIALLDRGTDPATTILLIEHNISAVEALCARSLLLVEGRVAADAATRDMLRDRALASVYFGSGLSQ
jgi:ABC-type branched-subunit amino acid transport system ATPase component